MGVAARKSTRRQVNLKRRPSRRKQMAGRVDSRFGAAYAHSQRPIDCIKNNLLLSVLTRGLPWGVFERKEPVRSIALTTDDRPRRVTRLLIRLRGVSLGCATASWCVAHGSEQCTRGVSLCQSPVCLVSVRISAAPGAASGCFEARHFQKSHI